jgi:hypothetical protein
MAGCGEAFLLIVTEDGIATQGDSRKIAFDFRWIKSIRETDHDTCFGKSIPFPLDASHNAWTLKTTPRLGPSENLTSVGYQR